MNHRLSEQSSYQTRMLTATGIVTSLAVFLGFCLVLIPVNPDKLLPCPTDWRGVQRPNLGNYNVVYDETGGCGASRNSMSLPTTVFVADSVLHAQEFGGAKIAGEGETLAPHIEAALIERLSEITHSQIEPSLRPPAPDLSFAGSLNLPRESISGCRPTIYLPDALYWPYSDPPPDTTVVSGVIVQGAYGWSFVLNSVTPDDSRVRNAVIDTFQRYLFITGKGEVYQPFQSVFIKGQRYSKVWYAVRMEGGGR